MPSPPHTPRPPPNWSRAREQAWGGRACARMCRPSPLHPTSVGSGPSGTGGAYGGDLAPGVWRCQRALRAVSVMDSWHPCAFSLIQNPGLMRCHRRDL